MDTQALQNITTIGALILGSAYVIGGLIVNLHLARYGITEYQVLRVKYLVVGLIFLVTVVFLVMLSAAVDFILLALVATTLNQLTFASSLVSLLGCIGLFGFWLRERSVRQKRWVSKLGWLPIFWVFSGIAYLFPSEVMIRQSLLSLSDTYSVLLFIVAVIIILLTTIAQLYYYAIYLYGNPETLDPIGMGIPVAVKLAGNEADMILLAHMGIPVNTSDMTDRVLLIDETDAHYIVATGTSPDLHVFKVNKELIKGIVYLR